MPYLPMNLLYAVGVSIGDTPNCSLVDFMENPIEMEDDMGYPHDELEIYGNLLVFFV